MKGNRSFAAVQAFFVLAISASVSAEVLRVNVSCGCGEVGGGIANRIVGGIETIPHEYPWVVALLRNEKIHCGATLITDRHVLTAGHCVKWTNPAEITVAVGFHDLRNLEDGVLVDVRHVYLHEDFNSDEMHDINDIAVIKLASPVEFTDNIKPICLPTKGVDYTNLKAKVIGWGRQGEKAAPSNVLKETALRVLSTAECRNSTIGDLISDIMLCTLRHDRDACQGDSGGPLLREKPDGKYEIIGIVSWGVGCAIEGTPGVYVRVSEYLGWIERHTKSGIFCGRTE